MIDLLPEPELEFGSGAHVDARFGIMNHGPLDVTDERAPKRIRIGIAGTPETTELCREWLDHCRREIPARASKKPHLFPRFPGFHPDEAFYSTLVLDDTLTRTIPSRTFEDLAKAGDADRLIGDAVDIMLSEFEYLERTMGADVLICAVPPQVAALMDPANRPVAHGGRPPRHFRHLLKARSMRRKPVQLMLASTADPARARKLKIRKDETRSLQDEATRAWNFHTALYYKAFGRPWRLPRDNTQLTTCYVGVSFYYTLDRETVMTSMAQVFDERGDGVIVRGGKITLPKDDRTPHLSVDAADALLGEALKRYRDTHQTLPARVAIHKTSEFSRDEIEGFRAAAAAKGVSIVDCVSVSDDTSQRLFRYGAYPPLRGTLLSLDRREHLLYTRGSVEFYETYPGMYVPRALLFRCDDVEQTPKFLAREMLALTKMNWNDTQFDGSLPITVLAARKVGDVLKYVGPDEDIADRYSSYM
jgi:hypothetical protein